MTDGRRDRLSHALRNALDQALPATDDPLDRVELIGEIQEVVGELATEWVDEAREAGASWADIADRLGVSRQAAHKRFAAKGGVRIELRLRRDKG